MPTATAPLRLDTATKMFSPALKGNDGQPVPLATNLIDGSTWMKVRQHMPWVHGRSHSQAQVKGELADLIAGGAVHVPHEDEHFRGVWTPAADTMPTQSERELRDMGNAERAQTAGTVETAPELAIPVRDVAVGLLPRRTPTAAKKTAPAKKSAAKKAPARKTAAKRTGDGGEND